MKAKFKESPEKKRKNKYVVVIYFLGSLAWLNFESSLYSHAIGIALMIAAIYGVVCINKNEKFLF